MPTALTGIGVFVGIAGGTFATLMAARVLARVSNASSAPTRGPSQWPTVRPHGALEPWELSASLGGPVAADEDEDAVLGDEAAPVGSGSPADLCTVPNPVPEEVLCVLDPLKDPRFAPLPSAAPFARPGAGAIWPVVTDNARYLATSYRTAEGLRGSWGREFAAKRTSKKTGKVRHHVGVDLFANVGDAVVAPEAGKILAILPFTSGTWAVYLRTKDDQVINLGEVQKLSWREFGRRPGDEVKRGDPVARIGLMGTKHMLHTEIYDAAGVSDDEIVDAIRQGKMQWSDEDPPPQVRDPSAYLVDAATRTYRSAHPEA